MGINYFRVDFVWKGSSQGRCERHYDDVLRCALWLLDTVETKARRYYLTRPTCATVAKNQSRCTWRMCPRSHDRLAGDGKGKKISSLCHGVYKGREGGFVVGASATSHQVYYC